MLRLTKVLAAVSRLKVTLEKYGLFSQKQGEEICIKHEV